MDKRLRDAQALDAAIKLGVSSLALERCVNVCLPILEQKITVARKVNNDNG